MTNYRIKIWNDIATSNTHIVVWFTEQGEEMVMLPVVPKFKKWKPYETVEPTFVIPRLRAEELLQSLAEALDENGIKTDQDAKLSGTLDATRYHLEDMRKLVFDD